MRWTNIKNLLPLLGIILLAFIFRFTLLDRIPTAISGDELHYVLTAKSIWLTGHDITGTWNPLSAFFFQYPPGERQAELPYFIHLLFSAPFPSSLFLAKLPFALLSLGIVILLWAIAQELLGPVTAVVVGLIAAVNPWLTVMGRTGYEGTPATFFYLLALYLLIRAKGWNVLWTIVPLIFAFYSYIATKLILIPFVVSGAFLSYQLHKKQYGRQYIVLCLTCILVTVGFVILLKSSPGSRLNDLILPNSPSMSEEVNAMRKASMQIGALHIAINKYTVYGQIIMSKLFRVLSPTYLFVEGDQFFLPVRHSFFYAIDFFCIMLGAIILFSKKRFVTSMLFLFTFIGTLPHLFYKTTDDFSAHLTLMFPFMILLAGAGGSEIIQSVTKRFRIVTLATMIMLYGLSVCGFVFLYFYQFPLVGSADFPMRTLSRYLMLTSTTNTSVIVYSNRSGDLLKNYIFYSNGMNRKTLTTISHINLRLPFTYNNIRFTDCDEGVKTTNPPTITIHDTTCMMHINEPRIYVTTLRDAGKIYAVYNDTICSKYSLGTYPSGTTMNDFAIERLPEKQFCETFITR